MMNKKSELLLTETHERIVNDWFQIVYDLLINNIIKYYQEYRNGSSLILEGFLLLGHYEGVLYRVSRDGLRI